MNFLNNLLFLSKGVQFCIFLLFVGIVLIFTKMASLEKRIESVEKNWTHYVTNEDYMETFNNMFDERVRTLPTSHQSFPASSEFGNSN